MSATTTAGAAGAAEAKQKPSPPPAIARTMHLVLTGASGYLGQHLLSHWIRRGVLPNPADDSPGTTFRITALYHTSEGFPEAVRRFRETHGGTDAHAIADVVVRSVDLTDPGDARSVLGNNKGSEETVVVHAAALLSPRACQENLGGAWAINVPVAFLDVVLAGSKTARTSILALSTDQVYDGTQEAGSYYREDEKEGLNPKNVYAKTKLELEGYLIKHREQQQQQQRSSNNNNNNNKIVLLTALRSSIILGPKAPIDEGCAHGTFLDFCKSRGALGQPTTYFTNEYRSVVRVDRVLDTVVGLFSKIIAASAAESTPTGAAPLLSVVYNMGGPIRVNRMEMARAVFDKFGYDPKLLIEAEQKSTTSPLDISMDSSLLFEEGILRHREMDVDSKTYLQNLVDYVFDTV